jgi:hypothetical protein
MNSKLGANYFTNMSEIGNMFGDARGPRMRGFGFEQTPNANMGIATPLFFPTDTSVIPTDRSILMKGFGTTSFGAFGGHGSYGPSIGSRGY